MLVTLLELALLNAVAAKPILILGRGLLVLKQLCFLCVYTEAPSPYMIAHISIIAFIAVFFCVSACL